MKTLLITTLLTLSTFGATAFAHDYKVGDLTIDHPYARSTPPSSPVAGGFMTITNTGTDTDRLIGGTSTFSDTVEIHEMVMVEGVMKMNQLENGLEIPPGETVVLKPGSYHIMFIGLQEQLKPEERRKGLIKFEKAGDIEIEYSVKDIAKMMDHSDMGDMKHGEEKMDHSAMGEMKHGEEKMDHSAMDEMKDDDKKMDHSDMGEMKHDDMKHDH